MPNLPLLNEVLQKHGYTASAIAATLNLSHPTESPDAVFAERRARDDTPFNVLFRLFLLGRTVSMPAAQSALAPISLDETLAGALLENHPEGVRARFKIIPYNGLYCASDFGTRERGHALAPDHVLGVGAASISLANLTIRRPVETALDVGTGAGIQALLAARHARQVVGTDTNPRALELAAFNAALNGCPNLEWRQGSYFDPVGDARFDLVVANPPFIISPQSQLLYRDSGLAGDAVSENVVRGAARRLQPGGFASILINWHHQTKADWAERPTAWFADTGCDAWLIQSGTADPLTYACYWLSQTESHDPATYRLHLDQWLDYYARLGIGRLSNGAVLLRRREGSNWTRVDQLDFPQGVPPLSPQLQNIFHCEDWLRAHCGDADLLESCLQLPSDTVAQQRITRRQGQWQSDGIKLGAAGGLPLVGETDTTVLQLLSGCDGRTPLRELISRTARATETDAASLAPACLEVVRRLLRSGLVLPEAAAADTPP
jgi:methylase of polypeptide subunit release factors